MTEHNDRIIDEYLPENASGDERMDMQRMMAVLAERAQPSLPERFHSPAQFATATPTGKHGRVRMWWAAAAAGAVAILLFSLSAKPPVPSPDVASSTADTMHTEDVAGWAVFEQRAVDFRRVDVEPQVTANTNSMTQGAESASPTQIKTQTQTGGRFAALRARSLQPLEL